MNNTYTLIDLQTDETVANDQTLGDLRLFVNDLFWQDDELDFCYESFEVVHNALLGCDYEAEIEVE